MTSHEKSRRGLLKLSGMGAMAVLLTPYVAKAAKRYTIAVVPKSLDNPLFQTAHLGAIQRAKELGDVDLVWTGSTTSDAHAEAEIVRSLTKRHVDGLAIDANAPQPLVTPINAAVDKGIKVITWDSDVPGSKRSMYYGIDNKQMGVALGEQARKYMGSAGSILLVSGGRDAVNLNARLAGVKQVFAQVHDVSFLGPFYDDDDVTKGQALMDNLLTRHPDAGAIVNVAGAGLFGKTSQTPAVVKNQGKVKIIAAEFLLPELFYVEKGYVQALVGQNYWGWGYQSVSILHNLLTQKSCDYSRLKPPYMPIVSKKNAAKWVAVWKRAQTQAGAAKWFHENPAAC